MRIKIVIIGLMLSCVAYAMQDDFIIPSDSLAAGFVPDSVRTEPMMTSDTVRSGGYVEQANDAYLLDIVAVQGAELQAAEALTEAQLIAMDTTSLFPPHIGYSDSLRIDSILNARGRTTDLCLPMLYRKQPAMSFRSLKYDFKPAGEPAVPERKVEKDAREELRRYMTTRAADLYSGMEDPSVLGEIPELEESKSLYEMYVPVKSIVKDTEADRKERLDAVKNKKNPWYKELSTLLQFTQNYVSQNWYEGGNSAFAMYASAKGKILYDNKKWLTWENTGEWVAGFSTVSGDSLRKVCTTDDLFRLYSKLGVKVANKIYVTTTGEFRTQLFRTYNANTKNIKTGPFTPLRINLAIGIDYKPVKGLSLVISPAAYKLVHAADTVRSNYTSYGIKKGEKTLNQFGSSVRVEWKWKPLREIQLETNLYTYTNYRSLELDLEINCDFIINRFMSARVTLHPRYDSALIYPGDEKAKMQFKELVSIGFAHKFY